jgi:alpha-beta hydrolase superfamily lysophospholipase
MGGLFALLATTLCERLLANGLQVLGAIAISPPFYIRKDLQLLTEAVRVTTMDREAAKALDQLRASIHVDPHEMYFQSYLGSAEKRPIGSVFELIHAIRFSRHWLKKSTFDVPILIIQPDNDDIVDNWRSRRFAKQLGAQIMQTEGKHSVILETGCRQVCHEIHSFIQTNK